jgi:hypothetical protein
MYCRLRVELEPRLYHHTLRIVVACVLLGAAWGKGLQLASDAVLATAFWETRWFLIALVLVEMAVGLCLLFGAHPRWTWFLAIALFSVFAVFNTFLAVRGDARCPCFGKSEVPPLAMGILDLLIALAMSIYPAPKPAERLLCGHRLPASACWVAVFFLGLPALLSMVFYSHNGLALDLRGAEGLQGYLGNTLVKNPSSQDLLDLLKQATKLEIEIEPQLVAKQPDYGAWAVSGPAWSVMLAIADRQQIPSRWDRTSSGYRLTPAAPWGRRDLGWFVGIAGLTITYVAFWLRRLLRSGHKERDVCTA